LIAEPQRQFRSLVVGQSQPGRVLGRFQIGIVLERLEKLREERVADASVMRGDRAVQHQPRGRLLEERIFRDQRVLRRPRERRREDQIPVADRSQERPGTDAEPIRNREVAEQSPNIEGEIGRAWPGAVRHENVLQLQVGHGTKSRIAIEDEEEVEFVDREFAARLARILRFDVGESADDQSRGPDSQSTARPVFKRADGEDRRLPELGGRNLLVFLRQRNRTEKNRKKGNEKQRPSAARTAAGCAIHPPSSRFPHRGIEYTVACSKETLFAGEVSMKDQTERGIAFRALHDGGTFVIPNPWDVGSAHVLASLGFQALATTSAGYAFSIARRDNAVGRDAMIAHVRSIAAATDLPVSGDLENGYGDGEATVAETIRLAAEAGLVGGSIEDSTRRRDAPIYELHHAVERIRAAAEAARSLPFPFTLTARAENYVVGRRDLADTIKRLHAYQEAGADVLYAPGLARKEDIVAVVRSVDRPVNVLAGVAGIPLDLDELAAMGVRRISVGSALARVALGAFLRAARELRERGTFAFANDALPSRDANALFPPD
jgi:2-methylisocitrate lyase-like PEP mutase family enzyme